MDRYITSAELARELGTSLPRIHRAVRKGVIQPVPGTSRRLRFEVDALAALQSRWGWTPAERTRRRTRTADQPPSREEMLVLAALSRRPLGLRSARAVARVAGISPTTAGRTLRMLAARGLVTHTSMRVVEGTVRDIPIWTIAWRSPAWQRLASTVGRTVLPTAGEPRATNRVPGRLWHLFWDTDPRELRLDRNGPYIADRVLRMNDLPALAWMTHSLDAGDLRAAARRRGLSVPQRRLAMLIAEPR